GAGGPRGGLARPAGDGGGGSVRGCGRRRNCSARVGLKVSAPRGNEDRSGRAANGRARRRLRGPCVATPVGAPASVTMRAWQLLLLIRPTVRSIEWLAPTTGGLVAIAIVAVPGGVPPMLRLELATIAVALGVSVTLDDAA